MADDPAPAPTPTGTMLKLAEALVEAGLPVMAAKAREGYYDDFASPLDFPLLQLAADLAKANTEKALALRRRTIAGDFDSTAEEAEAWADSPEGRAILKRVTRGE